MKARKAGSTLKSTLILAIASLALFALPGQAFAEDSDDPKTDPTTDPTAAQYAPPTDVVPPAVTVPQIPAPPENQIPAPPEKPVEQIQAGLGAGGGEQPAERVAVPVADNGPSLPFTGLDVAALVAVALALTGTGVVLRRLATSGDAEK